jgi:hypothetical protein
MSKCTLCEKKLGESQLICDVCYPDGKKTLPSGKTIRISEEGVKLIQEELENPSPPTETLVKLMQDDYVPSGPQPEFPLDELVLVDVKEPEIEFNYGLCKICEIPLTEEYEHVSFCGDCAEDTFTLIFSGDRCKNS